MEVILSVSEADLEEFPEEDTAESTGQQEQPGETSQIQGTVESLLSIITSPTPGLLERIKRGRLAHLLGDTPKGGSEYRLQTCRAANSKRPANRINKRPRSLAIRKHTIAYKRQGRLHRKRSTVNQ